jgi:glycyl-tRNA synthetase
MKKIVSLAKRRGFINQSSEIYGGVEAIWDYGPLGVLLKNNIKDIWWKHFVQEREDIVGIEGSVIMHPRVWEASGHLEDFTDPLIECKNCHSRFRADHLTKKECPNCGKKEFTKPQQFNLLVKTFLGSVEDKAHQTYLRGETAQSMFTNFKWVLESSRKKIPFGIAQIGKSFRNEITTGNFTFRSREFEIAEVEYFVKPGTDDKWFREWIKEWENFFIDLGIKKGNLRRREHPKEKLAHYSKKTIDIEYKFPWGWDELAGIANRTDYDLKRHSQYSGKDLSYFDEEKKETYIPYVIEPTMGIERPLLVFLIDAYEEIKGGRTKTTKATKEKETVLRFDKRLAPIKVAVLPLVKNDSKLVKKSEEVYDLIKPYFMSQYDEVGSIGRRYRRQDEIGTPFAITIDFDTLKQDDVTVRDRDTMKQERVKISELVEYLKEKLNA